MKLESAAMRGKDVLKLKPVIRDDTLQTTQMLHEVFENKEKCSVADLAFSVHAYLANGLATMATEAAIKNRVEAIGLSGGTASNKILASKIRKIVEAAGLRFLVHEAVPPGDGGLSLGQAVAVGFSRIEP